ncbi:MAG: hypothetical protein Q4E62_04880 [Sutterellaceae bacterium]|nr:hypothetical protein [Sutterellaceae bacterium]
MRKPMTPNTELLKKKGADLSVKDMREVFGIARSTLNRHETLSINGFPHSVLYAGKKVWKKESVLAYLAAQDKKAQDYSRLMNRGR